MQKEPDNQSDGLPGRQQPRSRARLLLLHSTFRRGDEEPYDSNSDTAYHFYYFVQDRLDARIMPLQARLADDRALNAASAMEYCNYLQSFGMISYFQDISSLQPTTPDVYMDRRGGHSKLLLTLPADSHAAIDSGELQVTPAKHAVISDPTPAQTGGKTCLSDFGENTDTPSTQLRMFSEAMAENVLIPESTQVSDDGELPHLGEQPATPIAQAMLVAMVVECIQISATVSNDGPCNNEFVIHCEWTTDAAQPVLPSPGMDRDPSATLESYTVLLSQETVDEDTSRVTYAARCQPLEYLDSFSAAPRESRAGLPQAAEGSRQSGCSPQRGQGGVGERKVLLVRVQRKTLQ